jgi:hypothetical protein
MHRIVFLGCEINNVCPKTVILTGNHSIVVRYNGFKNLIFCKFDCRIMR